MESSGLEDGHDGHNARTDRDTPSHEEPVISLCPTDTSRYRSYIAEVLYHRSTGGILDLSTCLNSGVLIGSGSFGDVYQGKWKKTKKTKKTNLDLPLVAIKVLRAQALVDAKELAKREKRLLREIRVWKDLRHKNIVPFIGTLYMSKGKNQPAVVLPWMSNGTLLDYIRARPNLDKELCMIEVIEGLDYLHSYKPSIIHVDLKAANILVDQDGRLYVSDFGLSLMLEDASLWNTSATQAPGSVRWMAPELLNATQISLSKEADIYAFAMTCFVSELVIRPDGSSTTKLYPKEILSGNIPFHGLRDGAVMVAVVIRNERPPKNLAVQVSERTWELITDCWTSEPNQRPMAQAVIRRLSHHNMADSLDEPAPLPPRPTSFVLAHALKLPGYVTRIATSPICPNFAVVTNGSTLYIADYTSGSHFKFAQTENDISEIEYSPDGTLLAARGSDIIQVWYIDDNNQYKAGSGPFDINWKGDGRRIGSFVAPELNSLSLTLLGDSDRIVLRDVRSGGTSYIHYQMSPKILSKDIVVTWSSSGKRFATRVAWRGEEPVVLHDIRSNCQYPLVKGTLSPTYVKFSNAEDRLAIGYLDGTLVVWDAVSFTEAYTVTTQSSWIEEIAFSYDGQLIASYADDKTISIIEAGTGNAIGELLQLPFRVECLAFSSDGEYLIAGSSRRNTVNLQIWRRE